MYTYLYTEPILNRRYDNMGKAIDHNTLTATKCYFGTNEHNCLGKSNKFKNKDINRNKGNKHKIQMTKCRQIHNQKDDKMKRNDEKRQILYFNFMA